VSEVGAETFFLGVHIVVTHCLDDALALRAETVRMDFFGAALVENEVGERFGMEILGVRAPRS
jgi:hypothetical protein